MQQQLGRRHADIDPLVATKEVLDHAVANARQ
jgi:hypothetical protein